MSWVIMSHVAFPIDGPGEITLSTGKYTLKDKSKKSRRFSSTVLHPRRQYVSNVYKNEGLSMTAGFH
jgi:hypothetical protein